MSLHNVGSWIKMKIPHIFEEHGPRDDFARVSHKIFKETKFARLKRNWGVTTAHDAAQEIDLQIGDAQNGFSR